MLWFIQHRLWDLVRKPALDKAFHEALARGLRGGEPRLRGRRRRRSNVRSRRDRALPRLPPLSRAEGRAGALPGRPARCPLRPHPVGQRRRLERAPGRHAPRGPRRPARERPRGLSHRALAQAVRGSGRGHHGRRDEDPRTADFRRPGGAGRAADRQEAVLDRRAALRQDRPERLVVRVDRTDPSKNILRGFRSFELLLERHPEHRGRVGMLALLDPSRQDMPSTPSTWRRSSTWRPTSTSAPGRW